MNTNIMLQIAEDAEVGWLIGNLEIKLKNAKEKRPDLDYKEQETIINILNQYRENYLSLIQENRTLKRLNQENCQKVFIVTQLMEKFKQEAQELRGENKTMKENIKW